MCQLFKWHKSQWVQRCMLRTCQVIEYWHNHCCCYPPLPTNEMPLAGPVRYSDPLPEHPGCPLFWHTYSSGGSEVSGIFPQLPDNGEERPNYETCLALEQAHIVMWSLSMEAYKQRVGGCLSGMWWSRVLWAEGCNEWSIWYHPTLVLMILCLIPSYIYFIASVYVVHCDKYWCVGRPVEMGEPFAFWKRPCNDCPTYAACFWDAGLFFQCHFEIVMQLESNAVFRYVTFLRCLVFSSVNALKSPSNFSCQQI